MITLFSMQRIAAGTSFT